MGDENRAGEWLNAAAAVDGSPPVDSPVLFEVSKTVTLITLEFLESVLPVFGLHLDDLPGGPITQALAALGLVLPITGLIAFLVSRVLVRRIREGGNRRDKKRALLESMLRPVLFQIWILGLVIGGSPLLSLAAAGSESHWVFYLARNLLLTATGVALVWFWFALGHRLSSWVEILQPGTNRTYRTIFLRTAVRSLNAVAPLIVFVLVHQFFRLPESQRAVLDLVTAALVILTVGWVLIQIVLSFEDLILLKFDIADADNLAARKVFTQVHVVQRVSIFLLGFLTLASLLLLFPEVRRFGTTMLASAGVAGIVIGLAMQRTLGNLFAGIQIAFSQPIRIDDVVVVEGEWGRIEEITLTYVVVKIWDWRRLVLPISYFIEKPFQNWTRNSSSVIGTVFVHADYKLDISEFRAAAEEIVRGQAHWDGEVVSVQVTECGPESVELRVLVSAADSPKAWDLRCAVREALLVWMQSKHPEALPRFRVETEALKFGA